MTSAGMTVHDGQLIAERILSGGQRDRPEGIFAVNDLVALGIMQTLVSHGVRVPGDTAILGFY